MIVTPLVAAITELSECVKELVRIQKCTDLADYIREARLETVYKKASVAKDRMYEASSGYLEL